MPVFSLLRQRGIFRLKAVFKVFEKSTNYSLCALPQRAQQGGDTLLRTFRLSLITRFKTQVKKVAGGVEVYQVSYDTFTSITPAKATVANLRVIRNESFPDAVKLLGVAHVYTITWAAASLGSHHQPRPGLVRHQAARLSRIPTHPFIFRDLLLLHSSSGPADNYGTSKTSHNAAQIISRFELIANSRLAQLTTHMRAHRSTVGFYGQRASIVFPSPAFSSFRKLQACPHI